MSVDPPPHLPPGIGPLEIPAIGGGAVDDPAVALADEDAGIIDRNCPVSIEGDLRHAHNVRTSRRDVARVEIGPDRLVHDIAREVIAFQLIGAAVGPHLLDRLPRHAVHRWPRSEEHTSELQSLLRISYAVFFLK